MKTILGAIDFSDVTERLIELARDLALAHGATLYMVHVEPPEPDFVGYDPGPQHVRDHVAREITRHFHDENSLRNQLRAQGVNAHGVLLQGPVVAILLEEARRISADLIVIGSHGHGALHHLLLGSVGEGVLRNAPCPVLVVPARRE